LELHPFFGRCIPKSLHLLKQLFENESLIYESKNPTSISIESSGCKKALNPASVVNEFIQA